MIATDAFPDPHCNHCYGLGYIGTVTKDPPKTDKVGIYRNRKCFCGVPNQDGTYNKFKHCCMNKVIEYKRSNSSIVLCPCVGSGKPITPEIGEKIENT